MGLPFKMAGRAWELSANLVLALANMACRSTVLISEICRFRLATNTTS